MAKRHAAYDCDGCPVEAGLEIIGGKWKGGTIFHLLSGPRRFSELRRLMPHVTQRILTKALRELEADGVLVRSVHPSVPPQVSYHLSPRGEALRPAILALRDWGQERVQMQAQVHQGACDGPAPRSPADPYPQAAA